MIYVALFVVGIYGLTLGAKKINSKLLLWLACAGMICIAGLRRGYIDTRAYRQGFIKLDVSEILSWDFLKGEGRDKGFSIFGALIKLFTEDSQIYLFILSLITVGCLFWGIAKRVPNVELGIFLLITTGCFLDTMNGVRQFLVSAILFVFLPKFIQEKKPIKYILVVLLMSTLHGTALLFIPLYFIARVKVWSRGTWGILVIGGLACLFFNSGIGQGLAEILEGTEYGEDYGKMLIEGNTSVNVLRIFVALAPLVLSFLMKEKTEKHTPIYTIAFNMSLINFLVWIFATRALYFYRLAMYFTPYMILLLCYEIHELTKETDRVLVYSAALILFFVFHLYSVYVMGDLLFVGYWKY